MITRIIKQLPLIFICLNLAGCSSLLPRSKDITMSKWQKFDELQQAYNQITPHKTDLKELEKLGFSPNSSNNVRIVNFLEVHREFDPLMTFNNLPIDVANCIKKENECYGFYIDIEEMKSKRIGNAALDVFNFKRITHTTGWDFKAKIIILKDTVVFKTTSSLPALDKISTKVNPLGPLQSGIDVSVGVSYDIND
ncbi:hypothetical protein L3V86_03785 [Thiotrichales bacterium 19S11-10]|nr:hypothetical protein [Thiotrichales bacterium 19S11-10]MCF6806856.1 hypothetical protein [Thiotrichales bacterium 19S9-11]MCF6810825.1 hypothetical protein [Thiotrichales bacterium 19S9-12]